MAWRCTGRNNDEMVDKFVHMGIITSKEVEDSFRLIPRGAFVPTERQDEAYVDAPIRGDPHVHMSAPHMYATILEALDLQPGLFPFILAFTIEVIDVVDVVLLTFTCTLYNHFKSAELHWKNIVLALRQLSSYLTSTTIFIIYMHGKL